MNLRMLTGKQIVTITWKRGLSSFVKVGMEKDRDENLPLLINCLYL